MIKKPIIKTAIIVDPMGHADGDVTPEMEIKGHKNIYGELLKPAKLKVHTPAGPTAIEAGTDLVVYDYGGMMPGSDMMEHNARALVSWAGENPNALIIVASSFTYRMYVESEMRDQGSLCTNIIVDDGKEDDPIPLWFRVAHELPFPLMDDVDEVRLAVFSEQNSTPIQEIEPELPPFPSPFVQADQDPDPQPSTKKWQIIEAPKDPVAEITVPVKCRSFPEANSVNCNWKLADCIVDVTEMVDGEEKTLATLGGEFYGFYSIHFPDGKGNLWEYVIDSRDFYPQFKAMHEKLLAEGYFEKYLASYKEKE